MSSHMEVRYLVTPTVTAVHLLGMTEFVGEGSLMCGSGGQQASRPCGMAPTSTTLNTYIVHYESLFSPAVGPSNVSSRQAILGSEIRLPTASDTQYPTRARRPLHTCRSRAAFSSSRRRGRALDVGPQKRQLTLIDTSDWIHGRSSRIMICGRHS